MVSHGCGDGCGWTLGFAGWEGHGLREMRWLPFAGPGSAPSVDVRASLKLESASYLVQWFQCYSLLPCQGQCI